MKTDVTEIEINGKKYVQKDTIRRTVKRVIPKGDKSNPFMELGKSYFIRTVTQYFTGTLIWVGEKELVLINCAWIADTGRFHQFINNQTVNEVEPFPEDTPVIIGRGSIIDMTEKSLLLSVK